MRLLIQLQGATELLSYEGCALALTLATFGHEVQLYLTPNVFDQLMQPTSRLHGMIQALDLYDLPPAWLPDDTLSGWLVGVLPADVASQLVLAPEHIDVTAFDQVISV